MKIYPIFASFLMLCLLMAKTGMAQMENVAVFGSPMSDISDNFKKAAYQFGTILGKEKKTLVYDGSINGLPASVLKGVVKEKARVIGVTTQPISDETCPLNHECRQGISVLTSTSNEQKLKMFETADVIVIMAGSWETLSVFADFTSLVEQKEQPKKPVIFLNTNHYWDDFQYQTDEMKRQHILTEKQSNYIAFVEKPRDVLPAALKIQKTINKEKTP